MSKLHQVAEALRWIPTLVLPSLTIAHATAIALYGALVRDWRQLRPILPRNVLLFVLLLGLNAAWFGYGPVMGRVDRWRHPQDYVRAAEIATLLDQGRYLTALQERAAMAPGTPAAALVEQRVAAEAPKIRSKAIAVANQGDYLRAVALVTALPQDGPDGVKRAWLLKRWAPFTTRQLTRHAEQEQEETTAFLRALAAPTASYDQLVREIRPRALHLDPAAATHVDGRVAHPLAPELLAGGVRAAKLGEELKAITTPGPAAAAAKGELMEAAAALKQACETSLAYANSADADQEAKAHQAFEEATAHRESAQRMLQALEHASTEAMPATPAASPNGELPGA